jgi:hypothetical protein
MFLLFAAGGGRFIDEALDAGDSDERHDYSFSEEK